MKMGIKQEKKLGATGTVAKKSQHIVSLVF
jgi:hypothetical protein